MNYIDKINKQLRDKYPDQDIVPQMLSEGEVYVDGEWILNSQLKAKLGARGNLLAQMTGHEDLDNDNSD